MLESISQTQLLEWMEFYRLNPWGNEIEDFRSGIIASTIANVNNNKTTPTDFMYSEKIKQQEKKDSWKYELNKWKYFVALHNATN
jgi:hypothetical protein